MSSLLAAYVEATTIAYNDAAANATNTIARLKEHLYFYETMQKDKQKNNAHKGHSIHREAEMHHHRKEPLYNSLSAPPQKKTTLWLIAC